jgi:histidyl-tRNA synthetase
MSDLAVQPASASASDHAPARTSKPAALSAVKGMNDLLPHDMAVWEQVESTVAYVFRQYGYRAMRTPVLEQTAVFVRAIGEVTDIVEKEMYTFTDALNGEQLTLRPENTAAVVRAVIEHNLLYEGPKRLWYFGPMFRHERPQKGRYRQFHQFGVEALGHGSPEVDAEQLLMVWRLWQALGLKPEHRPALEINSLGSSAERAAHREALVAYFSAHATALDADSQRRLTTNPLRILDSKNPAMQDLIAQAPQLPAFLGDDSRRFQDQVLEILTQAGLPFRINPRLVRGLDYYNLTVFEWVTDLLGAQGTVCGGGRYDGLIEMMGGKPAPACGFAIGAERLIALLQACAPVEVGSGLDAYLLHWGDGSVLQATALAEGLRARGLSVQMHAGGGSVKSQMKKADASGAQVAVILGEDERAAQQVMIKPLRGQGEQLTARWDEAAEQVLSIAQRAASGASH